ncbi:MAG: LysM peptidoglycan-binding domain-containing protein [Phycisphaeraceae bacterium]
MTRETKVGLVVGTGIILLIGIIVSDHLAANNRGSAAVPAPPGYVEAAGTSGQPRVINPRGYERQAEPAAEQRVQPITPAENLNPHRGNTGNPRIAIAQVEPGTGANGTGNGAGNGVNPHLGATGQGNSQHLDGTGDINLRNALRSQGVLDEGRGNTGTGNTFANNTGNTGTPGHAGNAAGGNGAGNTAQPPARQPEPIVHFVQPGERLWSIAERYYGNGKYWTIISQSNADKMVDARQGIVRDGVRLVIPHKSVVVPETSNAANTVTNANNGATAADHTRIGVGNTLSVRTVKVEAGDNLTRIAERYYRSEDPSYIKAVVEANRGQIRDADDIKAGMLLVMPEIGATSVSNATDNARNTANSAGTSNDRRATDSTPRAAATKTYTSQTGDTLSDIARKRLGDARRWMELHELNKASVPNANALREGIVLVLPADAR